jgi:ribose transport system substrate-binding protein
VEAVGGKCTITNAENSDQKQNQDVQDLMADGVNVLVIDPNGGAAIVPVIKEANAKHIPVFTVDNMADGGKVVSAIHTDNYEAGYGAAQFCAKKHGGKGDVAELQGLAGAQNVITRNAGWLAGLKKSPGLHLVYNEYTSWSTATAFADTQDLLEAHPNIACIWTQADIVAMGAAEAVSKIHKSNSVTIIGMGMYDGGPQAIAAGTITASWYMEPHQTGQAAGRAVLEYWDGKTTPAQINVPLTFVTKANVAQFSGDPDVGVVK